MKEQRNNITRIIYLAIAGGFIIGFAFGFAAATILVINTL